MDPEIFKAFTNSTAVTQTKGTSGDIMKSSRKRRRSKKEIQRDKQLEEEKKMDTDAKI